MTHLSDELLSAHIDGDELWSPDAAHLDECDECRGRLDALRGAASAVATPVTPPAGHVREAAVTAALSASTPRVRPITSARRQPRRMNSLSAAAALIVALGVGGWAISQTGRGSDNAANSQFAQKTESATAANRALADS